MEEASISSEKVAVTIVAGSTAVAFAVGEMLVTRGAWVGIARKALSILPVHVTLPYDLSGVVDRPSIGLFPSGTWGYKLVVVSHLAT